MANEDTPKFRPGTAGDTGPGSSRRLYLSEEEQAKEDSLPIFANGDASDAYANHKQLYLNFYHLAADRSVSFKGFIASLNDNFVADWGSEKVFGRGDPIMTFMKNRVARIQLPSPRSCAFRSQT